MAAYRHAADRNSSVSRDSMSRGARCWDRAGKNRKRKKQYNMCSEMTQNWQGGERRMSKH